MRINEVGFKGAKATVWARDNYRCRYCGVKTRRSRGRWRNTLKSRTVDHVIPVAKGGRNTVVNMVTACYGCNHYKGDKTLREAGLIMQPKPKFTKEQIAQWQRGARSTNCVLCGLSSRMHNPAPRGIPHGKRRKLCKRGGGLYTPANVPYLLELETT